eukprot:323990-Hanusia_phi.AAC.1
MSLRGDDARAGEKRCRPGGLLLGFEDVPVSVDISLLLRHLVSYWVCLESFTCVHPVGITVLLFLICQQARQPLEQAGETHLSAELDLLQLVRERLLHPQQDRDTVDRLLSVLLAKHGLSLRQKQAGSRYLMWMLP